MGIMSVENFLCCLTLKTGGYICGFLTALVSGLALVGNLFVLFAGMFQSQSAEWWVILIMNTIYLCLLCYASVMLIFATRDSNSEKMRLYLIFMVVGVVMAFVQIVIGGWGAIVGAIIWALVVFYFFVCIYSLFKSVGGTSIIC